MLCCPRQDSPPLPIVPLVFVAGRELPPGVQHIQDACWERAAFQRLRDLAAALPATEPRREWWDYRRRLIGRYYPLAIAIAARFPSDALDRDDRIGHACVTLTRAIDRFDPSRGIRFSTYLTRAIRSELAREVLRQRKHNLLLRAPDRLDYQPARKSAAVPVERIWACLEPLLARLPARQAAIVRDRFGLGESPAAQTLQSIADRWGISRERVRQLEQEALQTLREWLTLDPAEF